MATVSTAPPSRRGRSKSDNDRDGDASDVGLGHTNVPPEQPSSSNTPSQEDICAICLGNPENQAFTDGCHHIFCSNCLSKWAKIKAECPLSKHQFERIYQSVLSLEDYEQCFFGELQRTLESMTEYSGRRSQHLTTMSVGRKFEMMRQHQDYLRRGAIAPQSHHIRVPLAGRWA